MVDTPAVELPEASDIGELVHHAGGKQQLAGAELEITSAGYRESPRCSPGIHDVAPVKSHRRIPP